jgi:hypothetical protein
MGSKDLSARRRRLWALNRCPCRTALHRIVSRRLTSEPSWLNIGLTVIGRSRVWELDAAVGAAKVPGLGSGASEMEWLPGLGRSAGVFTMRLLVLPGWMG